MRIVSSLLIAALVFVLCLPQSAQSQSLLRGLARTGLVQEDVNIMARTAATLYASGKAQVGDDVIWSNPKTGTFGMAEIMEVEGNCVRIDYRFQTPRQSTTQTWTVRRCLSDGKWLLAD